MKKIALALLVLAAPLLADSLSDCKAGDGKKCYELGIQEQGKAQHDLAIELYKTGCEKKYAESCNKYGFMMELVKNNPTEGNKYYEMACEMGYGGGCNNIADKAKRAGDKKKALKYYDLGCKKGYKRSCGDGYLLKQGID